MKPCNSVFLLEIWASLPCFDLVPFAYLLLDSAYLFDGLEKGVHGRYFSSWPIV
jgi:hypothetical protein